MKAILKSTLFITIISVFLFSSCDKKYKDGPLLSLRTKKSRISGDWTIGAVTYNGNDQTAAYQTSITSFKIEKGGTYSISGANNYSDAGVWKFGEDKDDIYFTSNTGGVPGFAYRILRLKHKDVWLRQTQTNGDILILHLK